MAFDRQLFSNKLLRYSAQMQMPENELASRSGIPVDRLKRLLSSEADPSGDEILIFADLFMCDFRFFISNERLASFEQTEALFRKHGDHLSKADRWAIQEFLFLCECEQFLHEQLFITPRTFVKPPILVPVVMRDSWLLG